MPIGSQPTADPQYRYAAFISYRHVEPDRRWAQWLHTALETYRVPRKLRRERNLPARIGRCFRDEDELAASDDLAREIEQALSESRFLIVICSPRVVSSRWCNREVERFREMGRHDRILSLLIEGEPSESFLPALREIRPGLAGASISPGQRIEAAEPLAADVRPGAERTGHLRRMARLRLLATILGVRFDDLRQRELERQARRMIAFASVAVSLLVVMSLLLAFAIVQRTAARNNETIAKSNEALARTNESRAQANMVLADQNASKERLERIRADDNATLAKRQLAAVFEERAVQQLTDGDAAKAGALLLEAIRNDPRRPQLPFLLGLAARPLQAQAAAMDGHTGAIWKLALSSDGRRAVTAADDGVLIVWDTTTGHPLKAFRHADSNGTVDHLCFLPGDQEFVACDGGAVRIWDTRTGELRLGMRHGYGEIKDMALSPDGRFLVTTSRIVVLAEDATVKVWDLQSGRVVLSFVHSNCTNSARFSPDGQFLLTAANDGTAGLWDMAAKNQVASWSISADSPEKAAARFSPDGRHIATVGGKKVVLWSWDPKDPRTLPRQARAVELKEDADALEFNRAGERLLARNAATVELLNLSPALQSPAPIPLQGFGEFTGFERAAVFSGDGDLVAVTEHKLIRICSATDGRLIAELKGHSRDVTAVGFTPDGRRVISTSIDTRGIIWDWPLVQAMPPMPGHNYAVSAAHFAMGATAVVSEGLDNTIRIFDPRTGAERSVILHPRAEGTSAWDGKSVEMAVSPDGACFVTAGLNDSANVWDVATGRLVQRLTHGGRATTAAFGRDGEHVAVGGTDRTVSVWDWRTGREICRAGGFTDVLTHVELAKVGEGELLLASDGRAVRVYAVAPGAALRLQFTLDSFEGRCKLARFAPDGSRVLTADASRFVRVWDSRDGRELAALGPHPGDVRQLECAPDSRTVVTAYRSAVVHFWDLRDGKPLGLWRQPDQGHGAKAMAFHPVADIVAVAVGGEVFLLNSRTGDALSRLRLNTSEIFCLEFDPRGINLLTGGGDNVARMWPIAYEGQPAAGAASQPATQPSSAEMLVERMSGWRVRDGQLVSTALAGEPITVAVSHGETPNNPQSPTTGTAENASAAATQPASAVVQQARELVRTGGGARAVAPLTELLSREPDHSEALFLRSSALQQASQFDAAIADADHLLKLKLDPDMTVNAHAARATALMSLGRIDPALEDVRQAIALKPSKAAPRAAGATAMRNRAWLVAVVHFERAISAGDTAAEVYGSRGKAYLALRQFAQALGDFDVAAGKQSDSPEWLYLRGAARAGAGDLPAAIRDYTAAIRLNPRYARALNDRGHARFLLDPTDSPLDDYNAAIAADANLPEPHLNRAVYILKSLEARSNAAPRSSRGSDPDPRLADVELATTDLETFLRLRPDSSDREKIEGILNKLANFKEALPTTRVSPASKPAAGAATRPSPTDAN